MWGTIMTRLIPYISNLTVNLTSTNSSSSSYPVEMMGAGYVYTVVQNLGLCVILTDYLKEVLTTTYWTQVAITIPGIIGSAMAFRVSCLPLLRSSLSTQVALLALYDLVYLLTVLVVAVLNLCDVTSGPAMDTFVVLRQLSQWGATYTIVDISAERCLSIVKPFLTRKVCSVGFTLRRAAVVLALGVTLTVPFVLDLIFGFSTEEECQRERSLTTFGLVYTLYVSLLFFALLPFISVVTLNSVLAVALVRLGRSEAAATHGNPSSGSNTQDLTIFVLALSFWYCVCMLTPCLLFLVRLTRIELFQPKTDVLVAAVADTLIVLSAGANFLFYFLLWRHFRQTFAATFCGRCRKKNVMRVSGSSSGDHHAPQRVSHTAETDDI